MAFQLVEKQVIFDGKKLRLEVHHFQDEEGKRVDREVCIHNGAVVVLAFVDADHILLIQNHRYAIGQTLVELPAGTLEKGESPMNCAGRELQEETGYLAGRLKPLGNFFSAPGILSEKMYAFAAYDLEKTHTALEPGEEIELLSRTFDEAIDMIRTGEIADGKTIAALLMYERFFK
jgi:ADP-ribose pyrophosphatase